jgi:HK97 family phage prohead protease
VQYRAARISIVARVGGYAATWNTPFWPAGANGQAVGPVVLLPNAFTSSLTLPAVRDRILVLAYHDATRAIARPDVLRQDDRGLYFEATLTDTRDGSDLSELVTRGVIGEASIGFAPITAQYVMGTWVVEQALLQEISLVPWGANSQARVQLIAAEIQQAAEQIAADAGAGASASDTTLARRRALALLRHTKVRGGHYAHTC